LRKDPRSFAKRVAKRIRFTMRRSTAHVSLHDVAHIVRRNGQQPTTAVPAQQPAPPPPQSAVDLIRAIQARKRAREDPPGADGAAPATAAV